jgi:hypothetical protein
MPPANDDHPTPLSPLERVASLITLKDTTLLTLSPHHERLATVHDLVLLGFVWLLQFALWTIAFATYGAPLPAAIPAGVLVGTLIALLDIRLLASDTAPRGVLRRGPMPGAYFWFIGSRVLISLLLASVTATALDAVVFRDEALQVIKRETDERNAPIIAEYDAKLGALRDEEVGPLQNEVAKLTEQRTKALSEATDAASKIRAAHEQASAADLDQEREHNGVQRPGGDGPLEQDAAKRQALAAEDAQFLASSQKSLAETAVGLGTQIANANLRLSQAQGRYTSAANKLDAQRDGRLQKAASGPLSALTGLNKLRSDPDRGDTVWTVTLGAWAFVMTLELGYFLARAVFRPASFHDLALNADLRRRAARLAREHEEELRAGRRRPPLHVVGDREDANGNPADPADADPAHEHNDAA